MYTGVFDVTTCSYHLEGVTDLLSLYLASLWILSALYWNNQLISHTSKCCGCCRHCQWAVSSIYSLITMQTSSVTTFPGDMPVVASNMSRKHVSVIPLNHLIENVGNVSVEVSPTLSTDWWNLSLTGDKHFQLDVEFIVAISYIRNSVSEQGLPASDMNLLIVINCLY